MYIYLTPFIPLSLMRRGGRFFEKGGFASLKLSGVIIAPLIQRRE
jgi:hypothetical protein